MLRYQINDSSRERVSLASDIRFLNDYLNLEKIRRDNFQFTLRQEGEVDSIWIQPLLFIPFVENAVKHSFDSEHSSYIHVFFKVDAHRLDFRCENSKPAVAVRQGKVGGIGLANIQRRLGLLYPEHYKLEQREDENLYSVILKYNIMNCIIVDDEPLAREAMKLLIEESDNLQLIGSFNSAATASDFMEQQGVDLVFLDIQMPEITGIEFARTISKKTLVIFTTAYTEYALDSYEVDAIDYLIKPVEAERFQKAVDKALSYHSLLLKEEKEAIETIVAAEYFFVKAERRYFKVNFSDILFIEGLKDYVILQLNDQRIITRMSLKAIFDLLPKSIFLRVNKSYIVNTDHIESFDNNDIFIKSYEIAIGNSYRDDFFEGFVMKQRL